MRTFAVTVRPRKQPKSHRSDLGMAGCVDLSAPQARRDRSGDARRQISKALSPLSDR
jgi:hypothetical protein